MMHFMGKGIPWASESVTHELRITSLAGQHWLAQAGRHEVVGDRASVSCSMPVLSLLFHCAHPVLSSATLLWRLAGILTSVCCSPSFYATCAQTSTQIREM